GYFEGLGAERAISWRTTDSLALREFLGHLAHKAEHAVDLDTGAVVAVTGQGADEGDTATSIETLIEAAEQVETVAPDGEVKEVVADKGYHSNQVMLDLE